MVTKGITDARHLLWINIKKEVKHIRARMIPSYYRAWRVGHGTEGCQDRPRGLFSPEIRAVKSRHTYNFL